MTRAETEGIVRDRAQGRTQQVQRKRKQHVQRPWGWSELFRKQWGGRCSWSIRQEGWGRTWKVGRGSSGRKELAVVFILWKLLTSVFQNYPNSKYGMWKTLWRNSKKPVCQLWASYNFQICVWWQIGCTLSCKEQDLVTCQLHLSCRHQLPHKLRTPKQILKISFALWLLFCITLNPSICATCAPCS